MKRGAFGALLLLLYAAGLVLIAFVIWRGWSYYALPLAGRLHSPLHQMLKPSGLWGHGLGITGSTMILLLFLYSARKRELFGLRWGRTSRWLDIHIFFGIIGPILITLHTSLKFNGIVVISYYSMVAVMLSGILGRYLYVQIPRTAAGDALSLQEINAKDRLITKTLVEEYKVSQEVLAHIQQLSGAHAAGPARAGAAVLAILKNSLLQRRRLRQLQRYIVKQQYDIPPRALRVMMRLAREKAILTRKRAFLKSIQSVFHYWHVAHKPFAYVMVVIMFVHILAAITFGYRWIF